MSSPPSRRSVLKLGLRAGLGAGAVAWAGSAQAGAAVEAFAGQTIDQRPALPARPLPLAAVRLRGGPLGRAQDAARELLLALDPDRLLASFRRNAGLPERAKPYGGWDAAGRNLTGYVAGHALSAASLFFASTGDERCRALAHALVRGLRAVQDRHGDGYLSALDGGRACFAALARGEIATRSFDLNGQWSPWYTLHKTFAGLRDAYRHTGDRTALFVAERFAGWVERTLSGLAPDQLQRMLETEFGGMNEVLVDLHRDTGEARWLALSYAFEHRVFVEPLTRHQDDLEGLHANTQIPKLLGSAARFAATGRPADLLAAAFFFDRVAQHHSFATGGHGTDEYFGAADRLGERIDGRTAESCNVYNMLKLARRLFACAPDAHYADFHERALFNHALASFDLAARRMCYMVPIGPAATREYQDMGESFTCCVGTGYENHALAGDGLYFESTAGDPRLWVNLYAPSTADWARTGTRLSVATDAPEGETVRIAIALAAPRAFTLSLRRPHWTGDGFALQVNGAAVPTPLPAEPTHDTRHQPYGTPVPTSTYVDVTRTFRDGDVLELRLPKTLRLEPTPDMPRRAAILWGPLVLAADLGPEPVRGDATGEDGELTETGPAEKPPPVPVLVAAERPVAEWVRSPTSSAPDAPPAFRTSGVGRSPDGRGDELDVDLQPFYRLHRRTTAVYFDLTTPEEWPALQAGFAREEERARRLAAATIAFVAPGDAAAEKQFQYQGADDAEVQRRNGRPGRSSRSAFSYVLPIESGRPLALVVTCYTADRRTAPATFDVLVDGERIAEQTVLRRDPGRFFDTVHAIPAALVEGKTAITVRFAAHPDSQVAAIYGVRTVRADALP